MVVSHIRTLWPSSLAVTLDRLEQRGPRPVSQARLGRLRRSRRGEPVQLQLRAPAQGAIADARSNAARTRL